jgi:hypothetical protein
MRWGYYCLMVVCDSEMCSSWSWIEDAIDYKSILYLIGAGSALYAEWLDDGLRVVGVIAAS